MSQVWARPEPVLSTELLSTAAAINGKAVASAFGNRPRQPRRCIAGVGAEVEVGSKYQWTRWFPASHV
ncbi:hypothetical protein ATK17_2917 [Branchiibius hedensis]|uniref:Uncharacterized protein n=1 Tax=Branchiibius hedensis TaxID=672460 RepID=A0A2Y9C264_9MICO|nr:hypothetical protein ATK17_2917 [Branchiibius hedensis]SSA35553.1 hypothetical protein SAMN04489750_2917 [Branchiibius hedensis]